MILSFSRFANQRHWRPRCSRAASLLCFGLEKFEVTMSELDFSGKQVLVVGGSSGIGNGIAQAFRAKGARVAVCGTRGSAEDYSASEGSDLQGLDYIQLDVSDAKAIDRKSTRLNSSHANISYAVFCLKKKITTAPISL